MKYFVICISKFLKDEQGAMNLQSIMILAVAATLLSSFLYIRDDLLDFNRWKINFLIERINQGYDVSEYQ
jgi:hypothetical protein